MSRVKVMLRRLPTVLIVLVAAFVVGFMVVAPRVLGGATLTVLSGSMSPTIPTGSLVLVEPVDDRDGIVPGTVITFQKSPTERTLVTHRVVRFQPDTTPPSYITKGDANPGEDIDPVPIGAIRGQVVTHVPYLGTVADRIGGSQGRYLLGLLIGTTVLVTQARRLVRALREPDLDEDATDAVDPAAVPTSAGMR